MRLAERYHSRVAKQEFIFGEAVWATLGELARRASAGKMVATGYLGDRAGDRLRLGEGDVLLVAMSEGNAKNGSVSPKEVRRLQRLGTEVFVDERLHAKVYLFGEVVAVGSPNLSINSQWLHETLLVSRDRQIVLGVRRWFEQHCVTPVTPEWLDHCLSIYKPPRFIGTKGSRQSVEGRLWLLGLSEMEFPEDEAEDREDGEEEARRTAKSGFTVEPLRFTGSSLFAREVKVGDLAIQVWNEARSRRVYPHARIVGVQRTRSARGAKVLYVYVETEPEPSTISWRDFKREMSSVGLKLGRDVSTREIKAPAEVARAKALTRSRKAV